RLVWSADGRAKTGVDPAALSESALPNCAAMAPGIVVALPVARFQIWISLSVAYAMNRPLDGSATPSTKFVSVLKISRTVGSTVCAPAAAAHSSVTMLVRRRRENMWGLEQVRGRGGTSDGSP